MPILSGTTAHSHAIIRVSRNRISERAELLCLISLLQSAGVDIDLANQTKSELKTILASDDPRVLNAIGAFGSLYDFSFPEYESPYSF